MTSQEQGPIARFHADLGRQLRLLEALLEDPGLDRLRLSAPQHPAIQRYDAIRSLRWLGGVPQGHIGEYLTYLMDLASHTTSWAKLWTPSQPIWDALPSEPTRRFVRTRVRDSKAFDDVMAELALWGWLREQGLAAELFEEAGMPDLRIRAAGAATVWADVKHIRPGSSPRRAKRVIERANAQFKRTGDASGVVFVYIERAAVRAALDERVPVDVQPFLTEAQAALRTGANRSVALAVISWDEFFVTSYWDPIIAFVRRRSELFPHALPRSIPAIPAETLQFGMTSVMSVGASPEPQPRASHSRPAAIAANLPNRRLPVEHTQALIDQLKRFGVIAAEIEEVLADPQATRELANGTVLATRTVTLGLFRHVLLVIAAPDNHNRTLRTYAALRVPIDRTSVGSIGDNPLHALRCAVEAYGADFTLGGLSHRLVIETTLSVFPATFESELMPDREGQTLVCFRGHQTTVPGLARVEVDIAFRVDWPRYRQVIEHHLAPPPPAAT